MKKNLRKAMSIVIAMLVICANAGVLATAVPQKSEGGSTTTQQKYEDDTKKVISSISSKESDSSDSQKTSSENSSSDDSKSETSKEDESKESSETEKTSSASKAATSGTSKSSTSKTSTSKSDDETTSTSSTKKTTTTTTTSSSTSKATATPKASATPKTSSSSTQKTTTVSTIKPKTTSEADDEDLDITDTEEQNTQSGIIITDPDTEPSVNVVTNNEKVNTKRYLTKGGAFGMFLLTVLVSAVLSFLISYRFYKMNRTDSHVMAEIRALKRDIDSKMSGTVGGFSEYETRTSNSNPSYSKSMQGIRRENVESNADMSGEMYSKWESQIGQNGRNITRDNTSEARYSRTGRSTSAARMQNQRGSSSKIKDVFGDMFSKKK